MQGDGRAIEELFLARPATPTVQATTGITVFIRAPLRVFLLFLWLFMLTEGKELPHQEERAFFLE